MNTEQSPLIFNEKKENFLDILLNSNKIKLTESQRKRLEKQCAVNLESDLDYFDGFNLSLNSDNNAPNNDIIRNMGDVWKSRRLRASNPLHALKGWDGRYKKRLINSVKEIAQKLPANVLTNIINSAPVQEQKENVIKWLIYKSKKIFKTKEIHDTIFGNSNEPIYEFPDKNLSDHIRLIIQINDFLAKKEEERVRKYPRDELKGMDIIYL